MKCAICLDDIDPQVRTGEMVGVITECGHRFHEHCIRAWAPQHGSCPMCKRVVRRLSEDPDRLGKREIGKLYDAHKLREAQLAAPPRQAVLVHGGNGSISIPPLPPPGHEQNVGYMSHGHAYSRSWRAGGFQRFRQTMQQNPQFLMFGFCIFVFLFTIYNFPEETEAYFRGLAERNDHWDPI